LNVFLLELALGVWFYRFSVFEGFVFRLVFSLLSLAEVLKCWAPTVAANRSATSLPK
jgi:hypothetical protein